MSGSSFVLELPDLIPWHRYYLLDAGFGGCDAGLVPYRGVRYHLAEWGRANVKYVCISLFLTLSKICAHSGLQTKRNCSTFGMHLLAMSLSAYLEF